MLWRFLVNFQALDGETSERITSSGQQSHVIEQRLQILNISQDAIDGQKLHACITLGGTERFGFTEIGLVICMEGT